MTVPGCCCVQRDSTQSYVLNVVRSTIVPKMDLDQELTSKQDIAGAILSQLKDVMQEYVSLFEIYVLLLLYYEKRQCGYYTTHCHRLLIDTTCRATKS